MSQSDVSRRVPEERRGAHGLTPPPRSRVRPSAPATRRARRIGPPEADQVADSMDDAPAGGPEPGNPDDGGRHKLGRPGRPAAAVPGTRHSRAGLESHRSTAEQGSSRRRCWSDLVGPRLHTARLHTATDPAQPVHRPGNGPLSRLSVVPDPREPVHSHRSTTAVHGTNRSCPRGPGLRYPRRTSAAARKHRAVDLLDPPSAPGPGEHLRSHSDARSGLHRGLGPGGGDGDVGPTRTTGPRVWPRPDDGGALLLNGTPAMVADQPLAAWGYKHFGAVDYIARGPAGTIRWTCSSSGQASSP